MKKVLIAAMVLTLSMTFMTSCRDTKDKAEEATEEAAETLDKAGEDLKEAADDAADAMKEAGEKALDSINGNISKQVTKK